MSKNNENEPISVSIPLGNVTTDGSILPLLYLPKKAKLVSAYVMDGAGVSASNSNYLTLSLKNGSDVLATLDSRVANQGALVINTALAMLVDATKQVLAAGANLVMLYNESGTVAMTNAVVVLTYFPF
jgi:hypothetical protein